MGSYNINMVASLLHVHCETVRRWVRNNELKATYKGRIFYISENDLRDFIARNPRYSYALATPDEHDSKNSNKISNKITISKKDFEIIRDILCLNGNASPMTKDGLDIYNDVFKQHYDELSENGRKLATNRDVIAAAECMNGIRGYKNLLVSVVAYSYDTHDMERYANLISVKAKELEILLQKIDILPSQN